MFNDLETDDVSSVLPSCHLFGRVNILVCVAENAVFAAEGPKICDISGHQQYSLSYPHQPKGQISPCLPVMPHKAVAEVSKIGN